ncbi:hypothetical protein [Bacillus sp. 03113]|uniref:hypothetical protein n=1 Tax=Bacillus sp. 03113 TaxID=2578211 RepID=UPI001142F661|nr:hypothetical protein [Bacillus sp. 03113]
MNKNRYLLCLLVSGVLLYYALPHLNVYSRGIEGLFAFLWLVLFFIATAGNLSAFLFKPRKNGYQDVYQVRKKKKKAHYYD